MKQTVMMAAAAICGLQLAATAPAAAGMMGGPLADMRDAANAGGLVGKAQFTLQIGMSAERLRERLVRDGFDEIDVTFVGIIAAKADACLKGTRYRVKLRLDGTYEYRNEIGRCRRRVTERQLEELLERGGWRRIDINEEPGSAAVAFTATACRNRDRYELEIDEYGDIRRDRNVGPCRGETLSPREVRIALRKDGYDRMTFIDDTPPRYVVEACRGNERVRLDIGRRGRVRDSQRIGRCPSPIDPGRIEAMLERDGFDRIDIADRRRPPYRIEACQGNDRVRIVLNAWGRRLNETKVGECDPPITLAELQAQLRQHPQRMFRNIRVRGVDNARYPFIARACIEEKRYDLYFTKWGQFGERRDVPGGCRPATVQKIMDDLRDSGHRQVRAFVEACRRRVLHRIEYDEYGEEIDRKVVGRCAGGDRGPDRFWNRN